MILSLKNVVMHVENHHLKKFLSFMNVIDVANIVALVVVAEITLYVLIAKMHKMPCGVMVRTIGGVAKLVAAIDFWGGSSMARAPHFECGGCRFKSCSPSF